MSRVEASTRRSKKDANLKFEEVINHFNYLRPELQKFHHLISTFKESMSEFEGEKTPGAANQIGAILSTFQKIVYWSLLQYSYLFSGNVFPGMPDDYKAEALKDEVSNRPIDKFPYSLFMSRRSVGYCCQILKEIERFEIVSANKIIVFSSSLIIWNLLDGV
jgi:hypothetical protein